MAGLLVNRDQVFPHAFKRLRERLNIGRLRADMDVNAANVDAQDARGRDEKRRVLPQTRYQTLKSTAQFAGRDANECQSQAPGAT